MDREVGEQVTQAVEDAHRQRKENECPLKPESCNILESHEIVMPVEVDYSGILPQECADIGEAMSANRSISLVNTSENPCSNPFVDDAGIMVEELMLKSYDGSSLAIIGMSNNRDKVQLRNKQWHHLYHLTGGLNGASSLGDGGKRVNSQDIDSSSFPELMYQKPQVDDDNNAIEPLTSVVNKGAVDHTHGGIRTKIISKSGFSDFFVKRTLKGKGILCKGPSSGGSNLESRDQSHIKVEIGNPVTPDVSLTIDSKSACSIPYANVLSRLGATHHNGVNLRDWLRARHHKANKVECLSLFKRIVDLVDRFHSQGVPLHDLRPSYFKLLPLSQVKYLGSPTENQILDTTVNHENICPDNLLIRKRPKERVSFSSNDLNAKKKKLNGDGNNVGNWSNLLPRSGLNSDSLNNSQHDEGFQISMLGSQSIHGSSNVLIPIQQQLTSVSAQLEDKWYTSPEGHCTTSSNVYCLGVLLFELLSHFESEGVQVAMMSDLRHRILPRNFLSQNAKEAGFCLWLLHPEPSTRPTTREILQSEVLNGLQEVCNEEFSSIMDQEDAESEMLLHFLVSLRELKQKDASKLVDDIRCLEADIAEVERRHSSNKSLESFDLQIEPCHERETTILNKGFSNKKEHCSSSPITNVNESRFSNQKEHCSSSPITNVNESRLMKSMGQLETAYFSMRSKIQHPEMDGATHPYKDLLRTCENCYSASKDVAEPEHGDPLGAFFDGLCKYARYRKFEVRGVLRNADFNNPVKVICSLSFDRDEDYFAAAGISKRIKIFEFNALLNDSVDIHYPVIEMSNRSNLSCVSWNNYIKNYLASTDYDGVVKLWDVSTGQTFSQFTEHEKRAWSVDFSQVCPTKFATGSDDCSVKLWSINEKNCLGTIKSIANVCCVQFSALSTHLLAFGSADYRTYCYDLRNVRIPWCVLVGHEKTVSYAKFLDSKTLVSASTDNTLKIWDLNKTNPTGLSTDACSLTLTGHTNEKNFVGLSVADGYIACGSETNEVYAYYRSLPMPITAHKFGSIDPISGKETDDDDGQFVSSVCWRGKSDMVVAANSSGCIKVLQMV